MRPIADTGLLVGFLDSSDQHHDWAAKCFDELRVALTTCEAVIAETEYLVPGSGLLLMEMMKRYPKMQFADACVVRLSETLSDSLVYTTDKRDFSIYRRRRNEPIKTVTP